MASEHKLVTQLQELIGTNTSLFPDLTDAQEALQALNEVCINSFICAFLFNPVLF
jgi:hypothetical protein